jgi:hypothetical protein
MSATFQPYERNNDDRGVGLAPVAEYVSLRTLSGTRGGGPLKLR